MVTSPPYWGLRDYGTARWEGGDEGCDHLQFAHPKQDSHGGFHNPRSRGEQGYAQSALIAYRDLCGKCGARRIDRQIGLEPTPDEYVATMVGLFRDVWRVLKDDGTVWLNLGDSYAAGKCGRGDSGDNGRFGGPRLEPVQRNAPLGLKPKDLCGIPWRVAFALQADGWYLRCDIIWAKSNPMPESVTDRPTRSHEYVFLLAKAERYYYDADAIREPAQDRPIPAPEDKIIRPYKGPKIDNAYAPGASGYGHNLAGRNKRSVWTINSEPTPEAHFATFPQKLVEPCVLAGSRPGDLVFDPFIGSGTVGKVAERLGRKWAGLELSAAYIGIAKQRTQQIGLGL